MSANSSITDDNTNDSMEEEKIVYGSQDMDVSARKSVVRSVREIELEEMLTELKEEYNSLEGNDPLKLKILTIAPSSWKINKIAKEFGASWQLAKKSKEHKACKGILLILLLR